MRLQTTISIWFFIGVSLLVNGALILAAGIAELLHPPEVHVILFQFHANVWWGATLFLIGAIYCYFFNPFRPARKGQVQA